jgi:hypothetical protein
MTAIAYTWKIERLDAYPTYDTYENVVCTVHWRVFASGTGCEATSYGTVDLDVSTVSDGFTPFEDLTEAQVVGWVRPLVGGDAVEADLAANIENQLSPPIVSPPLPWLPAAEP